jgi:hypothetical protein
MVTAASFRGLLFLQREVKLFWQLVDETVAG